MAVRRVVEEIADGWRIPDGLGERITPLLPPETPHSKGGRPWTDARRMMDGIFYVLRTGCQWKALPRCFRASRHGARQVSSWNSGRWAS